MATQRLIERSTFGGGRVDRQAGIVRGVVLCGSRSDNGRTYPARAFGTGRQYEGRPVNVGHGDDRTERSVTDRAGWIESVTVKGGKPNGDLHLLLSHPITPAVLEAAERNPGLFGLSHVARCTTSRGNDGTEVVESVVEVESVDLVASPATVKGLFESIDRRTSVTTTIRGQLRAVVREAGLSRLAEQTESMSLSDALKAAALAIVTEILTGQSDRNTGMSRLRKLLDLNDSLKAGDDSAAGVTDDGEEPVGMTGESRHRVPTNAREFAQSIREGVIISDAEVREFARRIRSDY